MPYGYTPPAWSNTPSAVEPGDGRSSSLQLAAQESADKYRTGIAEMATDEYGRLRNIYDLKTNEPILTFDKDAGKAIRGTEVTEPAFGSPHLDIDYGIKKDPQKGALLSDLERMQLTALKMGHKTSLGDPVDKGAQWQSGLGSLVSLDPEGNPLYNAQGELQLTGLGRAVGGNWNELVTGFDDPSGYGQGDMLQDIIEDYHGGFDQRFYGMDDFDWGYYGGRPGSEAVQEGTWGAIPLSEIEPVSMSEMVSQYAPEFENRAASHHYARHQPTRGLEYLGRPEFGTRLLDYS